MKNKIIDIIYSIIEFLLCVLLIGFVTYMLVGCGTNAEESTAEDYTPQELVINVDNYVTGTISVYDIDGSTVFEYYGKYQIKHNDSNTNVIVNLSKDGDED